MGTRWTPAILLCASIGILVVSALNRDGVSALRMQATDRMAPLLSMVSAPFQAVADAVGEVSGLTVLRAENERLRQDNTRLREWYQTALMLEAENQSLRRLLNVKAEPQHSFITTRVIGDAGQSYVKSALIAAGRQDGLEKGQAVLSGDGVLGRIVEVGETTARVLLLTDINSRIPVLVEGSNQRAILAGTNGEVVTLEHLPPDTLVESGARIVTSGHGGLFPSGLPVGLTRKEADGQITVRPFAEISRVVYVRVLEIPHDPNLIPANSLPGVDGLR